MLKTHIKQIMPSKLWRLLSRTRYLLWTSVQPFRFDYSPCLVPWFEYRSGGTDLDRIHRIALGTYYERLGPWEKVLALFSAYTWPLRSIPCSVRAVWAFGSRAAQLSGVSRLQQFIWIIWLANRQNIATSSFYKFQLYRPEKRRVSLKFIQHHEIVRLLPKLNRDFDTALVDDKAKFHEFCIANSIPTPRVFAFFERGEIRKWHGAIGLGSLPRQDLFLKPTDTCRGDGIELWRYRMEEGTWEYEGQMHDQAGFLSHCLELSRTHGYIIQERVAVSPEFSNIAGKGLCTLRIVTYNFPHQIPKVLTCVLKMPTGDSYMDNFYKGGIAAQVSRDGRLGTASGKHLIGTVHVRHPDTGGQIEGFEVPSLTDAQRLCLRGHKAAREVPFVGWDVAPSESGWLILDANPVWCVELVQMPSCAPLCETDFIECYMSTYRHRIERTDQDER